MFYKYLLLADFARQLFEEIKKNTIKGLEFASITSKFLLLLDPSLPDSTLFQHVTQTGRSLTR